MPTYLMLMSATETGTNKISEIGDRYDSFRKQLKKSGGRLVGAYGLLGGYDYCAIVELPSEKDLLRLSLAIAERGGSRVQTYRAFPMDEFCAVAKDL